MALHSGPTDGIKQRDFVRVDQDALHVLHGAAEGNVAAQSISATTHATFAARTVVVPLTVGNSGSIWRRSEDHRSTVTATTISSSTARAARAAVFTALARLGSDHKGHEQRRPIVRCLDLVLRTGAQAQRQAVGGIREFAHRCIKDPPVLDLCTAAPLQGLVAREVVKHQTDGNRLLLAARHMQIEQRQLSNGG